MIVTMLIMIRLCVEVRKTHVILKVRDRTLSGKKQSYWDGLDFANFNICGLIARTGANFFSF